MMALALEYVLVICIYIDFSMSAVYYSMNNEGLTEIPLGIWTNVTHLYLRSNDISAVDSGALVDIDSLEYIDFKSNKFTEFPNLCEVGGTLKRLYLYYNTLLVNAGPVEHLACLNKLYMVDLSWTGLESFPDLTPIGDTLGDLRLRGLGLSSINDTLLTPLTDLKYLYLEDNSFMQVPPLQAIGGTLRRIYFSRNNINFTEPEDWIGLTALQLIGLAYNELTAFPNLTYVGATLTDLYLEYNLFAHVELELLDFLSVLRNVGLGGPSLSAIPDLGVFNTTLVDLRLGNTGLGELPVITNMGLVSKISIGNNLQITEIPDGYFTGWDSLTVINFANTPIEEFPNLIEVAGTLTGITASGSSIIELPPDRMAILQQVTSLDLQSTAVTTVPTTCPAYNVSGLDINLVGSSVDLCLCSNLWLKLAKDENADIMVDGGIMCGGELWADMSFSSLRDKCLPEPKGYRFTKPHLLHLPGDAFCSYPLHTYIEDIPFLRCTKLCLDTPGCLTFNFQPHIGGASRNRGKCVTLAPSSGQNGINITALSSESWQLYELDIAYLM